MAENNYFTQLWTLGIFLIASTTVLGLSGIIIVATNDYIYYNVYEIADDMVSSGLVGDQILQPLEDVASGYLGIAPFLDKFWLIAFIVFFINFLSNSYHSRREGYFSVFGFLSFGMMAILFMLNLLVTFNDTVYDLFFNKILGNFTIELTFFNFYLNHFQVINLVMISLGLILCFVPFDLANFNSRKDVDNISNDEVL